MAKSKTLKVPTWLGNVELRYYDNRRDFYDSVGLTYIKNHPHTEIVNQIEMYYRVEYDQTKSGHKIGFRITGLTELGEIVLEMKNKLQANGSSFDKITFYL